MRFKTLAVASAFLFGCGDDTDAPTTPAEPLTIAATVAADARFATLATALETAELTETLAGDGPFTVFAPTEEAFAALPEGTLEALLADKETLTDILTYHVINDEVTAAEVVALTEATALNGDAIEIAVVDGGVVLNGSAKVTITDLEAANGIIHVIDAVLMPPEDIEDPEVGGNLAVTLQADGRFGTLLSAVAAAELGAAFAGDDKLTVLAPTDAAFAALPEGALAALLADKEKLTDILTYHAVAGDVRAETVVTLKRATALNGVDFAIAASDAGVTLNGTVKVLETDIVATNGVIHVIDAVLLPPGNIVEVAAADGRFETLIAAVEAAELDDDLAGPGPLTVLAPTDDAFAALPEGTVEALLADVPTLSAILSLHVTEGRAYSDTVATLTEIETLGGETVEVTVEGGKVFIGGAEVIVADIIARNGVIHVIDAVILPPAPEPVLIPAALAADGRFSTLLEAVGAADLGAALSGDSKLTVFAPTNAAFAALPEGALAGLLANKEKLTDVLTYHVVAGEVKAETVVTLKRGTSLNGVDFAVAVSNTGVTLNGNVRVTQTDIIAANGVIHVIDAVLLPPGNIVEIASANADFETLVTAVVAAELEDDLAGPGPFTVFAPTDDAFAALPEGALAALLADAAALGRTLGAHVVSGKIYADAVVAASPLATLATDFGLDVTVVDGKVFIEGAEVVMTDIIARNGVIHVIKAVIVP
jgi:transforming growth factor-beta-induced protein